jgi:hypothetical protein
MNITVTEKAATKAVVINTLVAMTNERNGVLPPQDVVEAARAEDSPLHDFFEWNDSRAAEAHRLNQARALIRVVINTAPLNEPKPVRMFVSLPPDRNKEGGYRLVSAVLQDDARRAQMLETAYRELESFQNKYSTLEELASITQPIEKALSKRKTIDARRSK